MSNIEKINDYQVLSDDDFCAKYDQTKSDFLKEWENEKQEEAKK